MRSHLQEVFPQGELRISLPAEELLRARALTSMYLKQIRSQVAGLCMVVDSKLVPNRQTTGYMEEVLRLEHDLESLQIAFDKSPIQFSAPTPDTTATPPMTPMPDIQHPPPHSAQGAPRKRRLRRDGRETAAAAYSFHLAALRYAQEKSGDASDFSGSERHDFLSRGWSRQSSEWQRDLTQEGIEPNPGPPPKTIAPVFHVSPKNNPSTLPVIPPKPDSENSMLIDDHPVAECFQRKATEWMGELRPKYGPQLKRLNSGEWFEEMELPSPKIFDLVEKEQSHPVQLLYPADGLPNPRFPAGCETYHVFNQNSVTADCLMGKHALFSFTKPLPFEDSDPIFSFRSWCQLVGQALANSPPNSTQVSILLVARHQSPTPRIIPLLDRRFEMEALRKYLSQVIVLPDMALDIRDCETGLVEENRAYRQFPLMLFILSNATPRPHGVITRVENGAPSHIDVALTLPESQTEAFHILLNCEMAIAFPQEKGREISALRILMHLNQMDPSETTSQFRMASAIRYPPSPLPQLQRAAPDGLAIAHYHVPHSILQHLNEDRDSLCEIGITWALLPDDMHGMFLVNHLPNRKLGSKRMQKSQALEVRDSILVAPSVSQLMDLTIILNRWDVLIRPAPGVLAPQLAETLKNLDNLALVDACQLTRILLSGRQQIFDVPHILVMYPLHMTLDCVLSCATSLAPAERHQDLGTPGSVLLTLQNPECASILYGLKIVTQKGTIAFSSGSTMKDAASEKQHGLPPKAPWAARKVLIEKVLINQPPPRLSAANLSHVMGN